MSLSTEVNPVATRRRLLRGAAAGGAVAAAAVLLPGEIAKAATAPAAGRPGFGQVAGVDVAIDASHATSAVVERLHGYFQAKSDRDPVKQMSFFSRKLLTYIDATLGWHWYSYESLLTSLKQFEPAWSKTAKSYPYWILGDTTSAIVAFTDGAGTFFADDLIDTVGCVNFGPDGKIVRWVDYWDGRHSGVANVQKYRYPASQWPKDFRADTVGETASPTLRRVVYRLADALRKGDAAAAAALFSPNIAFDDVPAHVHLRDRDYVAAYLSKTAGLLPYTGPGTAVRHVLGSHLGGGYEWTAARGPVARGVTVIELDPWGKISRLAVMWDGSLITSDRLTLMAQKSIEH